MSLLLQICLIILILIVLSRQHYWLRTISLYPSFQEIFILLTWICNSLLSSEITCLLGLLYIDMTVFILPLSVVSLFQMVFLASLRSCPLAVACFEPLKIMILLHLTFIILWTKISSQLTFHTFKLVIIIMWIVGFWLCEKFSIVIFQSRESINRYMLIPEGWWLHCWNLDWMLTFMHWYPQRSTEKSIILIIELDGSSVFIRLRWGATLSNVPSLVGKVWTAS